MKRNINRRKLLKVGGHAVVGTLAACSTPVFARESAKAASVKGVDYYAKLGVTPFINAAGTYTVLSASTMPPEVQAAIALASKQPVHLNELLVASRERLSAEPGFERRGNLLRPR